MGYKLAKCGFQKTVNSLFNSASIELGLEHYLVNILIHIIQAQSSEILFKKILNIKNCKPDSKKDGKNGAINKI